MKLKLKRILWMISYGFSCWLMGLNQYTDHYAIFVVSTSVLGFIAGHYAMKESK